jgi:autotransporter-associated beta strand protein
VTLAGALTGSGGLTLVSSGNPANTNGLNGSGVLTLTGTNTYTGNTTVSNGTLAIAVASIATNSTVTVAGGGAKLQLDFATTNRVGALVLNGVTQTSGVYNSTTGAPFITGLGSLEVVSTGPSGPATLTNSVSGGVLSLAWPAGQGWRLECQTNPLTVGLGTNWVEAAGSSVSNTNITIDATRPTVFYRLVYP